MSAKDTEIPREHPLLSLLCNIVAPVIILNKFSSKWGAAAALVVALAFPLGYGIWDYFKRRKTNFFSILGLLNTLITGGLALVGVTGMWFAVKEAAFPLLLGIFVFFSANTSKPAVEMLFLNPAVFQLDRLREKIGELKIEDQFHRLLMMSTRWLAVSFFLSAALNFILATRIFLPLPDGLDADARSIQLNEQIASMHQWSFLVILVPSMIFLMTIFYVVIRKLKQMTGLGDDDLFKVG